MVRFKQWNWLQIPWRGRGEFPIHSKYNALQWCHVSGCLVYAICCYLLNGNSCKLLIKRNQTQTNWLYPCWQLSNHRKGFNRVYNFSIQILRFIPVNREIKDPWVILKREKTKTSWTCEHGLTLAKSQKV